MAALHQTPPEVAKVARELTDLSDRVERWTVALDYALAAHRGVLTAVAVERIVKPAVETMLADAGSEIAGAGFVSAAGLVSGNTDFMAWWQGPDIERVDALANLSTSPEARYRDADWYRNPVESGRLTVTGPYVDLLCTDSFALTYTAPVGWSRPEGPVGVAGVDVTVSALERRLTRTLAAVAGTASLVNAEDRIIVTTSPLATPGDFAAPPEHRWPLGHGLSVVV
ncbi:cache domain-containing protein [Gordonia hydrophobica]|uniref:Cache domain-containing protein n=1 Tax=Gordonia hydrophobica TaxID=40516 RepID=A0ABZ2U4L7_9ACTN|nr:cache domain-containing protein [Gordonia hydrophobica]MBM7368361.1 hypothetical protein [Gordonia hydrophobica]